jgi:histone acetyltransferase (RNA polymerase elongator complex component)
MLYKVQRAEWYGAGYGTMLMQEAEEIARNEHGSYKLAVSVI